MRQFKSTQHITERNKISVNNYLKEVSRYPMATLDEEVALAQKIRQGGKEADMDVSLSEDTDTSFGDIVSSGSKTDESLDKESLQHDMKAMLNQILSAKEREILMRSFGIDCKEEGLEEIGFSLGLSRERVRQIHEKALIKIRRSNKIEILAQYIG